MAYVPNNVNIFIAAYAGAISGMAVAQKVLIDEDPADYASISAVAGAFAKSFDTEWGLRPTTDLDLSIVEEECEGTWEGRYIPRTNPKFLLPATYTDQCQALIALVTASELYFASQGIAPPGPPVPIASTARMVIFKPGVPSSGDTVSSWAEVAALIVAAGGLIDVYVDSSLGAPIVSTSIDCKGKTNFLAVLSQNPAAGPQVYLQVAAGSVIRDPASFKNMSLNVSGNNRAIDITVDAFVLSFINANLFAPTMNVPAIGVISQNVVIEWINSDMFGNFAAVAPYIFIEAMTALYTFLRIIDSPTLAGADSALVVGSVDPAVFNVLTDGSSYLPAQTQLNGTQTQSLIVGGQAGTTAERPLQHAQGQFFFDSTLGRPIWWNAFLGSWVYSDGTPA